VAKGACPPAPPEACRNATEPRPKLEKPRGVLFGASGVETGRISPGAALAGTVEHFWWVRWTLLEPRTCEVLTYPSVHVVFEGDEARVTGVVRARFSRTLHGSGAVFAVKFLPGMFRPFWHAPIAELTDRVLPLENTFGRSPLAMARELGAEPDELARARRLEAWLLAALPARDADAELARDLVGLIRENPAVHSVAALSAASGLPKRALQRLFRECVGVAPKWVVRRFRLQEAAERLKHGSETVAEVAASLGYFDQAHFVRDFKAVAGVTPVAYRQRVNASRAVAAE
jgi:AraC-like DNA-binding protein